MENHIFEMEDLFVKLNNAGQKLSENLRVAMILRSLPDSFDALCTALESRSDTELTLDLIRPKLIDEAAKHIVPENNQIAMKVKFRNNVRKCYFCGKLGHVQKFCRKFLAKEKGENSNSEKKNQQFAKNVNDTKQDSPIAFSMMVADDRSFSNKLWIIDSGATSHMCCEREFFEKMENSNCSVVILANGKESKVQGIGSGKLKVMNQNGEKVEITLNDVLFVPELETNLISVNKIVNNDFSVIFNDSGCKINFKNTNVAVAIKYGNLFKLKMAEEKLNLVNVGHPFNCQHFWHRRFGHRDPTVIGNILKNGLASGLDNIVDCGVHEKCEVCLRGKMARLSFPKQAQRKTTSILDLIHSDVCGPIEPTTPAGNRYFMTLIDDYSRFTTVYCIKKKSEVAEKIIEFVKMCEVQFGRKIKSIRSDQGGEYTNKLLRDFFKSTGIHAQYTAAYSPQQNGISERKNRYLVESARCMLIGGDVP
jgi:hypothetical protein